MVSVNPVSFTAPNVTGTPQQPMPRSRSELLAYMLEKGSPATPDYSSVSSPVEGFAKALTSGLQGYMAKKTLQGEEAQRLAQANATADLLFGPTADGAPDPRRDAYVKALTAGVDIPVGGAIASKLGLGDPPEPIKLGQGDTLVDPRNYQPLYTAPQPVKPYSKPAEVWDDWNRGFFPTEADRDAALANLNKAGTSLTVGPDGEVQFTQGGTMKPLTEAQSKDTVFVTRAAGALPLIDQLGDALTSLPEAVGGGVPIVGNYMKTPEYRQAEQAGKEFLQAILRKDTGAAITKEETQEYGTVYLPQPGDDPATLEQKKQSRARAVAAIEMGLPPAAILALERAGVNRPAMPPQGGGVPEVTGPPEGVTPEEWEVMTPEERALWQ